MAACPDCTSLSLWRLPLSLLATSDRSAPGLCPPNAGVCLHLWLQGMWRLDFTASTSSSACCRDSCVSVQALSPLFSQDERPTTRDNACGAVGRLILALGAHLPVDQVLPVMLGKALRRQPDWPTSSLAARHGEGMLGAVLLLPAFSLVARGLAVLHQAGGTCCQRPPSCASARHRPAAAACCLYTNQCIFLPAHHQFPAAPDMLHWCRCTFTLRMSCMF